MGHRSLPGSRAGTRSSSARGHCHGVAVLLLVFLAMPESQPSAWAEESAPASRSPHRGERPPIAAGRRSLFCEPPQWCHRRGCLVRGFDGTFFLRDVGNRFRVDVAAYLQLRLDRRWNMRTTASERTDSSFEASRGRLIVRGHLTDHVDYHFRIGFNEGGANGLALGQLTWHAAPRLDVTVGEQFIAVSREDWMFVEDLVTTDYSANDSVFGTGVSSGIQATYTGRRDRVYAALSDARSVRENDFAGNIALGDWAATGRYERQFGTTDWSAWDDLIGDRGQRRGLLLGVGAGFRADREDVPGDALFGTVDASFAWRRGSALAYASIASEEASDGRTVTDYGGLVQVAWFATSAVQTYGRFEFVSPGSRPRNLDTFQSLTLGCSYRPFRWSNRARLSLEYGHFFSDVQRTVVPASRFLGIDARGGTRDYLRVEFLLGF